VSSCGPVSKPLLPAGVFSLMRGATEASGARPEEQSFLLMGRACPMPSEAGLERGGMCSAHLRISSAIARCLNHSNHGGEARNNCWPLMQPRLRVDVSVLPQFPAQLHPRPCNG